MNSELEISSERSRGGHHRFSEFGLEELVNLRGAIDDLQDTLLDIDAISGPTPDRQVAKLSKELRKFEPSITMVGQIKSGKTSLVNAMIGQPELLPADVNPWTSVVTSLHLNTHQEPGAPAASFQFFDGSEWDRLVSNGGRIGELSMRAGADDELKKVREQVAEMREKTRTRLGRKFELLLGQRHDYGRMDDDLIQRYVCLGDEFDEFSTSDNQGQFADITKSADLYLKAPAIPLPFCIRDTPGVNDTFMMREQITINSLRDSRLCVVVLSASQALSSADMGLIRLISNVKSKDVVIFVNRIDELADPVAQLPDIHKSIVSTLSKLNMPVEPKIVFGSAYWATVALSKSIDEIDGDSADALDSYAKAVQGTKGPKMAQRDLIWLLSGIPTLYGILAERIAEGPGARLLSDIRSRAENHVRGLRATCSVASVRIDGDTIDVMEPASLDAQLTQIETQSHNRLKETLDGLFEKFSARVDQSHSRFLDRALEVLLQHLEQNGDNEVWQYNPDGLRALLRTSCQVMRKNFKSACETAYDAAATDITNIYSKAIGVGVDGFTVTPPVAPEVPAPVSLGATIALDLQTSWWKGWWQRRKGHRAYADEYYSLIEAETAPLLHDLKDRMITDIRAAAESQLSVFLAEQRTNLMDIVEKAHVSLDDLNDLLGINTQNHRAEILDLILSELTATADQKSHSGKSTPNEGVAA
ncbi:MAG: dynamin family protein [Sulfitobacter sp.]